MKTLQGILDRVSSSFVKFLIASRDDLSLGTFFKFTAAQVCSPSPTVLKVSARSSSPRSASAKHAHWDPGKPLLLLE